MTIDEFIAALEQTPAEIWHIQVFGRLRTFPDEACPIEQIAATGRGTIELARQQIALSEDDSWRIVFAADNRVATHLSDELGYFPTSAKVPDGLCFHDYDIWVYENRIIIPREDIIALRERLLAATVGRLKPGSPSLAENSRNVKPC